MKAFFSVCLILSSFISSAQFSKANSTEFVLTGPPFRNQTGIRSGHSDSENSIDTSLKKSSCYKSWYKLSLFEIGISYSPSEIEDSNNNKFLYAGSLVNFATGFHRLGGLGFGSSLSVFRDMPGHAEIHSWVPLYAYLPVYISRKKTKPSLHLAHDFNIPFMVSIYAGASLWCSTSPSFRIAKDAVLADKFYHVGVNGLFLNFTSNRYRVLNGSFSFDSGVVFFQVPGSGFKNVINFGLVYTFIGITKIAYQ